MCRGGISGPGRGWRIPTFYRFWMRLRSSQACSDPATRFLRTRGTRWQRWEELRASRISRRPAAMAHSPLRRVPTSTATRRPYSHPEPRLGTPTLTIVRGGRSTYWLLPRYQPERPCLYRSIGTARPRTSYRPWCRPPSPLSSSRTRACNSARWCSRWVRKLEASSPPIYRLMWETRSRCITRAADRFRKRCRRDTSSNPTSGLLNKVGSRVLPDFLTVVDNPQLTQADGHPLFGNYKFDEEGVPSQETVLVKRSEERR